MFQPNCVVIRDIKIYKTRIILYSYKCNYMDWGTITGFTFVKHNGMFSKNSKLLGENSVSLRNRQVVLVHYITISCI